MVQDPLRKKLHYTMMQVTILWCKVFLLDGNARNI